MGRVMHTTYITDTYNRHERQAQLSINVMTTHSFPSTLHPPPFTPSLNKTRQDETTRDETRQDKTRQDKTRQEQEQEQDKNMNMNKNKTRQDKTRQDKTITRQQQDYRKTITRPSPPHPTKGGGG